MEGFGHATGPFGQSWVDILRESTPIQDPAAAPTLSREQTKLTKMVCTAGPASWSEEGIAKLVDAGMNVLRLNFSHGDHATHAGTLERLRRVLAARAHAPLEQIAVMLDTKGPEIRTGMLEGGGTIRLTKGQRLVLTTDYDFLGTAERLACSYEKLAESVRIGSSILVADGALTLKVTELLPGGEVATRVENDAEIGERKNMNLPGAVVQLPVLTDKDVRDVVDFGITQGVDYIAASFVRNVRDVELIRSVLRENGGAHVRIIAKIENQEGLENYAAILEQVDGIMLARGDLGMELPPEKLFQATKWMLTLARAAGKPTITATQMLESMTSNPRPTRAECIDVAQAVLDGSHATMLSGETAKGAFFAEAARTMSRITRDAELTALRLGTPGGIVADPMAISAARLARETGARLIVVIMPPAPADGGGGELLGLVQGLAALYLSCPCLVPVTQATEARALSGMYRGIMGFLVGDRAVPGADAMLKVALGAALVGVGDHVVLLDGTSGGEVALTMQQVPS